LVSSVCCNTSEPLPFVTGHSVAWQNEVAQGYETAVTHQDKPMEWQKKELREYVQEYTAAVLSQGYRVDARPISQQRAE
jgi:hypothetical protein